MKQRTLFLCILLCLTSGAYSQRVPYRLNTKWGYADMTGKLIIPARYDNVWRFQGNCAVVKLNKKYGMIDSTGKQLLPVIYDEIDPRTLGKKIWYRLQAGSKYGLANPEGKLVLPLKYDDLGFDVEGTNAVALAGSNFTRVTPDGTIQKATKADWQKLNEIGTVLVEGEPYKKFMMPYTLNNKKGYLVRKPGAGYDSIPAIYDEIDDINIYEHVLRVKKDGLWGVIGPKNNIVFPFLYKEIGSASPGLNLYSGKKGNKSGILKANGEVLIPFEYDRLYFTNDEFWCISYQNGKQGIIVLDGSTPVIIPARYKKVMGNPVEVYEYQGEKVRFYEVETAQGYGYVREDGTDFFKDK